MLISHEYQFIFIKTRKTAGTSIEVALSRYLGPWDVITPISPSDELARMQMGIIPRNYLIPRHTYPSHSAVDERGIAQMLKKVEVERKFYNHCPASEIRAVVGERIWNSYTKFCFERNPYERVVSEYYFQQSRNPERYEQMTLEKFVAEGAYSLNYPLYYVQGQLQVDFVGRYESLETDLQQICAQIGIPYDGWLPQMKGKTRTDRRPATELLSPTAIQSIANSCALEFELLKQSRSA